ncbi:MAG: alkaline phosphatase family protein [Nostoc sp.]|uniref:alkaline phosphatase family protein n=1 Tax=Nostoc sp. TaxID=1180 RepID=UPI002FF4EDDA
MLDKPLRRKCLNYTSIGVVIMGLTGVPIVSTFAQAQEIKSLDTKTLTPIKHVIVIVGENRTFDHVFGVYQPRSGQTVSNLLSKGIINADGTPGPNFQAATQYKASVTDTFSLSPANKKPYTTLPPPKAGGGQVASDTNPPPFKTLAAVQAAKPALLPEDFGLLLTGATGLPSGTVDTRIRNVNKLRSGPFQLTPGVPYEAYAASPVHRFYQMWQQVDCDISHASANNPSGCLKDLFPWVEVSVGAGSNGKPFSTFTDSEGATSMGFYNVNTGDMPYFKSLADNYAISDNYHQPVMGGTGANSVMIGIGDAIWYSNGKGSPATPPPNEIENPNPQPGTNNFYTQDGYSGGTYTNCSNPSQPGVRPVLNYLNSLSYKPKSNCAPNTYYLLNNYDPGYFGNGTVNNGVTNNGFVIPPSSVRTIGDALLEKNISWRYYGEGWNRYVKNPSSNTNVYCNICNPFQYVTSIMTNEKVRTEHLKDTTDLDNDINNNKLPAVSFAKPGGLLDGHPASSKFNLFEAFTKKIIKEVQSKPELWKDTAILITVDEGGGYWDSGYIQPIDFFGDGTRIPLIVVSPYSRGGRVVHTYYDHVSILKFIEKNWGLSPLTNRSRDNLPNPQTRRANPYVPINGPAIGDLIDMFDFSRPNSRG